jgi:LacI family transcriptional regulator
MANVTIRDLAKAAGVSVGTASRVINQHPATSPESRAAVQEAATRIGFTANARARSLRSAKAATIGLLVSDIRNPFFAEIAEAAEQAALAQKVATILCNANEDTGQQDLYLRLLAAQRVDGIIVAPQGDGSGQLSQMVASGTPMVFVDRVVEGLDVASVVSDNQTGIRQAVAHLRDLGHTRVGFVSGPQASSTGRGRLNAFQAVVAEAGLDADPALVFHGDFQTESGEHGARTLLALDHPPTAIIAADSLMTLGVVRACRELDVEIGPQLSLIGYDDLPYCSLLSPALTVIAHDPARMGEIAAGLILDRVAGKSVESVVLPSALLLRDSTAPAPAANPQPKR